MSVTPGYEDFLRDVLSGLGPVTIRKMFGGGGVYLDGVMFGLIGDDTLYLKADETSTDRFEAEGKGPFIYQAKDRKPIAMSYWQVPEHLYDEPDELVVWARQAHNIAVAAKSKTKKAKKPRRKT
ncbi:MAG: TfoX/Sxy family protein [Rhizobiales bacterium]|nr:TfoX/Sxy family protein [Hyphomicrobiales bacterium]